MEDFFVNNKTYYNDLMCKSLSELETCDKNSISKIILNMLYDISFIKDDIIAEQYYEAIEKN